MVRIWPHKLQTAAASLLALAGVAVAQPQAEDEGITLSPAVERALDAVYLTDQERQDLRVFHGQWIDADLADPVLAARAALFAGDLANPALDDPQADPLDRAEAMILRGDIREALDVFAENDSMRALRLRARAFELLGDLDAVRTVTDIASTRLPRLQSNDAETLTEGVRILIIRARTVGVEQVRAITN